MSATVLADTEPNDSFATAEPTYDGAVEYGTVDDEADSTDYYSIYLNSGEILNVEFSINNAINNLTLYNPEKGIIAMNEGIVFSPPHKAVTTGTYYISIFLPEGGIRAQYSLVVTVSDGGVATGTDTDGDGVPDNDDAFPNDPAASLDADDDGFPDAWNPGYTAEDSTTELTLDPNVQDQSESNMMQYLIITIIVVVIVVVVAVLMLRSKGPKKSHKQSMQPPPPGT
ncbi:MAG: hypothetical protein KKH41_03610 [Candidatus Thermoplasmatota archaeon]|nr:hypothetical protein [Candidatus Thermoplasmatota archaeon]MBU4144772.1 hypothetical protein [Candidatus Thermoplasmatota archaeon]MBU4591652.1 hypothetical protein [Candidatus Thermoplasmatota archaeon]